MIRVRLGSGMMFLAVGIGAFGAHALRDRLSPSMQGVFETGVRYHFYHALALFVMAWLSEAHPRPLVTSAGWALTAGLCIFSGSLHGLSLSGVKWWGAVTPVGGLALLVGWALLAVASFRLK